MLENALVEQMLTVARVISAIRAIKADRAESAETFEKLNFKAENLKTETINLSSSGMSKWVGNAVRIEMFTVFNLPINMYFEYACCLQSYILHNTYHLKVLWGPFE